MSDFPTLASGVLDASPYEIEHENPAVPGGEMDGGYVISRPRHTRTPRRTFYFFMRNLTEADRITLKNFWNDRRGASGAFNFTTPITLEVVNVRFGQQMRLRFPRTGYGTNHRWDTNQITLEEV